MPHEKTTYVVVNDPRAGGWKVESLERRKPLTRVAFARGLPKPKVKAKLRKRGKRMVLTYTLSAIPGQKVTFNELGGGVATEHRQGTRAQGQDHLHPDERHAHPAHHQGRGHPERPSPRDDHRRALPGEPVGARGSAPCGESAPISLPSPLPSQRIQ